ncbi:cupin domain-containing protein [uncultured Cellulomonas sp.]|uniref:cupin domain-containing protein n=1 Tax=uncultured Cellulomonas sp. TaxID=189682 RepID=UPI0028EED88F|nr:cupin domain-containing protein [uncultured Cellulomonas sp.]
MRLLTIPQHPIASFGSTGVTMQLLPQAGGTSVHVAHLAPGGTLGRHPAVRRQLFVVVAGRGEVQVDDDPPQVVGPGTLVVWEPGEVHQTWATTDLTAVIVETSEEIDLSD